MTTIPDWALKAANRSGAGRKNKYPFRTMELHEVFSLPADELPPTGYNTFKNMLYARGKLLGRKFVSRQLEDGTVEVCRVA